jgi:uncharacterized protein YbjT (DUF2867 family)
MMSEGCVGAILLTGASGFIGRHLADALVRDGHDVVCAVRDPARMRDPRFRYVAVDFVRDTDAATWLPRLAGIDIVINAVGILREHRMQTFDAIHSRTPRALFAACLQAGVKRVLQISALGADAQAVSRYHRSKKEADDYLASLPLPSVILQPSLIYGPGGTSARLFTTLASLPLQLLPGQGRQQVQPVHIDDLVDAVQRLARPDAARAPGAYLAVVGPEPMSMRTFIASLREAMGGGRGYFVAVPPALVRLGAQAGSLLPGALLDPETLAMLERGNTGDAAALTALLGRPPRPVRQFIAPPEAAAVLLRAKLNWLLPMLRLCIALVWILTGIVSLGLYPVEESYALLARTGITGWLAPVMLYGAALLDLGFGIATLFLPRRHWLWIAQLAIIGFYTVIITFRLPEFWLHPYGPLSKNLPMLGAIFLLLALEERPAGSA